MNITCYSYEDICDYIFDENNQNPKDRDIVLCQIENFNLFIEHCKTTSNRYVVVSPRSDFGIEEQALHHPNHDVYTKLEFITWEDIVNRRDVYLQLKINAVPENGLCNLFDKYVIKTYAQTHATFAEVPDNIIRWFCVNCNVKHPKIENIPFGMGQEFTPLEESYSRDKTKLLYINFSNHTLMRLKLNDFYKTYQCCDVTQRTEAIPWSEYIKEMAQHKFVLCPNGNGYDSYRIWEALYLGCIPIVERTVFSEFFNDLPVLIVDDMKKLVMSKLEKLWYTIPLGKVISQQYNCEKLKLEYWEKKFNEYKSL